MPTLTLETNVKVSKSTTMRWYGVYSLVLQLSNPKEFILNLSKVEQVLCPYSTWIYQ